ncbi:MAG: ribonuclease J [Patescibacteria group bacterium]
MIKKNENSFSAVSITPRSFLPAKSQLNATGKSEVASPFVVGSKKFVAPAKTVTGIGAGAGIAHKSPNLAPQRTNKRIIKSSTFQYSKIKSKPYGQKKSFNPRMGDNKIPPVEKDVIRIVPLGGVEEVGRNMLVVESENDIIILDVGFHFVEEEEAMGADFTLPNFKYLEERKEKIRAVVITHGHLDHIGGIPFIMERIGNPPIYAQNLTTLMIRKRQEEYLSKPPLTLNIVDASSKIKFNELTIRFFPVYHSIPDSMGAIIETPFGNVLVSGDMKVEHIKGKPTPKEEQTWGNLGKENNLLLIADSTSASLPGFSIEEKEVQKNIEEIIKAAQGRLIIGTFASQFERLIKIIEICERHNKYIVLEGRSIKNNMEIAKLAGLLSPKKETIIEAQDIDNYPPNKVVIIATGAQGEEFAALMRIATNKHKCLRFTTTDTVMLSSSVIPGNEVNIQKLIDHLYRHDLKLIHYGIAEVHSGGHARQEDLLWINKTVKPKFFIPGYGSHSMLRIHAQLVHERNNFPKENIVVPDNGMLIEIVDKGNKITVRKEKAPSNMMIVDGFTVGDTQDVVVRDRVLLAQDGMFVIVVLIDQKTGKLRKSPDLISRGFVYLKENQELLRQARINIKKLVETNVLRFDPVTNQIDFDILKANLGEDISKFLYQKTAKKPLVIPVILSV